MSLLEIENLRVQFRTPSGISRAVDGLSLSVRTGEVLAIVGESGCGKSVTAMSILRLLPERNARADGAIRFEGQDLLSLDDRAMQKIRGKQISMVFQEPMTSLNPLLTIGRQIGETLRLHEGLGYAAAESRVQNMLRLVGIPEAERRLKQYPHELSGGMRQRVMIAMALACSPRLLIADEPTTALDVTVQAQVLDLMRDLIAQTGTGMVLITHDFGVVAEMAQRVVVMYAGRKVEEAPVRALFAAPRHPYTRALLDSVPRLTETGQAPEELTEIPGIVPALTEPIRACTFAPRCARAIPQCQVAFPPYVSSGPNHVVACWNPEPAATPRVSAGAVSTRAAGEATT